MYFLQGSSEKFLTRLLEVDEFSFNRSKNTYSLSVNMSVLPGHCSQDLDTYSGSC